MPNTPMITPRVPPELVTLAREAVGEPVTVSELVRIALAKLAGVDPNNYQLERGVRSHGRNAA
jgi:hypothetical protein